MANLPAPVQLIRIDEAGKCHVQEEAAALIRQVPGKLAVVGIAGLYRTGKSFLLNRLLGIQDGFMVGPTVNPCTKGIWMWGEPVQLAPNYHCLLIDTEGLGSAQRTTSCDMQIFSLCILLSSYFVYNSMGAIDEQAIDDLHLVLNLAQHIHSKSEAIGAGDKTDLSRYFPSFLWVLRDFHLRLVNAEGKAITERDYLEEALKPLPGQEEKNTVRSMVKDLFPDRDCITLVRPVVDETDLRHIERLPYESLRPQFRTQVESFVNKVFRAAKPKQVGRSPVSGPVFVNLVSEYCEAINASAVPTIQSAWTSAVNRQLRTCLNDAVQLYKEHMNVQVMELLPMSEVRLREIHLAAESEALRIFMEPGIDETDPRFVEYRAELSRRVEQVHMHVESENSDASRRQCTAVAEQLYEERIAAKINAHGSYVSFDQLSNDWDRLREAYLQKTAGPAQAQVLSTALLQRMTDSMQRVHDQLQKASQDLCNNLEQRHAEALKHSSSLEQAKLQWQAERQDLEKQLEAKAKEKVWAHPSTLEHAQSGSRAPWRRTRALPPCLKEGTPPPSTGGRPADRPAAEVAPVNRSRLHYSTSSTHTDLRRVEDESAIGNHSVTGNGLPRPKRLAKSSGDSAMMEKPLETGKTAVYDGPEVADEQRPGFGAQLWNSLFARPPVPGTGH